MKQDQSEPAERPRLQVITDEPSLEQRAGIVLLDGREVIRLCRRDLRCLMRDAEGAISQMDWYWATYFYVSDYHRFGVKTPGFRHGDEALRMNH